jgi:hypothetical protein
MLAQIWTGGKGSTVDDFNPYQIAKRKTAATGRRKVTLAQALPLLNQWVPEKEERS